MSLSTSRERRGLRALTYASHLWRVMKQFIKSHLARIWKRTSPHSGEPLLGERVTWTPIFIDPLPPTVTGIEQHRRPWANRFTGSKTWNLGQSSVPSPRALPKSPLDTAPNYRLPFDILVQIFSHYAEIEDANSPLERLLEVCHFWRDTALDYRTLWTTFRLHITNSREVDYWRKRFPQRADRFGPDTLLDITIELVNRPGETPVLPGGTRQVASGRESYTGAHQNLGILNVVGGRRGAKAVRWKSLSLNVINLANLTDQDRGVLDRFLQSRTPNLVSVELYGVITPFRVHKRIFPYTPRLRKAIFHSCELSHYPDTSTLLSLTWYSLQDTESSQRNAAVIQAIKTAQKVTVLEIGLDWTYWDTSLVFQRVKTLKMPTTVYPDFVIMIQVPSLRHLSIGLDSAAKFAYIKDCKGIPLGQVETLEICYVPRPGKVSAEEVAAANAVVVNGLRLFFAQMTNLRVLEWKGDMVRKKALLKLVVELFMGGRVGDAVIQQPGRMIRNA